MNSRKALAVELAKECENRIRERFPKHKAPGQERRDAVNHLLWMCQHIVRHGEDWPSTKLHRWVGFIQGQMVAFNLTTIDEESKAVRDLKLSPHCAEEFDTDLAAHHDPEDPFELELGVGD